MTGQGMELSIGTFHIFTMRFQNQPESDSWLVQSATIETSLHITTSNGIVNHRLKKHLPLTEF